MAKFSELQANLVAAGYDVGGVDGKFGAKTMAAVLAFSSGKRITDRMREIAGAMVHDFIKYEINTPPRMTHFIAQAAHETDRFVFLEEIWGPTAAQKGYEGRKDLGNHQKGDGYRFKGRGIFQLTGRDNYKRYGERLGLPLEDKPDLAASASYSVTIACLYWSDKGLNAFADQNDIKAITKRINGGFNGLSDREFIFNRLRKAWGF